LIERKIISVPSHSLSSMLKGVSIMTHIDFEQTVLFLGNVMIIIELKLIALLVDPTYNTFITILIIIKPI